MCVCVCVCVHIYIYVCVCVHIYIYIHMPILAHVFEVNSRDIDNAIAVMLESFIQSQKHQVPRLLGAIALY